MGFIGRLFSLLVACSHLVGCSWAGPINARFITSRSLQPLKNLDYRSRAESGLWLRSISSSTGRFVWTIAAVVGIILLFCIFVICVVLVRRAKDQQRRRPRFDEELGFGHNQTVQPQLAFPPRAYDGVSSSQSPPPMAQVMFEDRTKGPKRPPPLLIVSPPEEPIQKPKRVPVPRLSTQSPSPGWNGLPISPRLITLPPSPLPTSVHVEQSSSRFENIPLGDPDPPVSSRSPASSSKDQLSPHVAQTPLSAGGLDRMMTQMEMELKVDEDKVNRF